ncbi:MAG TPA: hypothetical protein VFL83_09670 [Anaeromyxobacter sp.]|nr:hypothetical protein [Anaeromyxobacter sp.]
MTRRPAAGAPPVVVAGEAGPAGEARALARRLAALEEGPIRTRAAARHLAALEPGLGARVLAAVVRGAGGELRAAAAAVARAIAAPQDDLPYAWLADAYAAAAEEGLDEVTALLVSPPPRKPWKEPRDRADPRLAHLTLGHKKALARANRDPDLLARLAAEGEPSVVRELLANPKLTEEFVVRIAARRPCRPTTLRCIREARRWRARAAVALAVARNPYAETGLALGILPTLGAAELLEIAADGALHPLVRALAHRLAARRLP